MATGVIVIIVFIIFCFVLLGCGANRAANYVVNR